jgi:hypothetical protein
MKPLLLFYQQLRDSSQLLEGRLLLIDTDSTEIKNTYIATSGSIGNQSSSSVDDRGRGPIPPVNAIGIDHYTVATAPLNMTSVKGVEGNFYKIDPHFVQIEGVQRGDFGIHRDANVPGSAGCVVLRTPTGWQGFEADMKTLATAGIKQVPLLVSYSK